MKPNMKALNEAKHEGLNEAKHDAKHESPE